MISKFILTLLLMVSVAGLMAQTEKILPGKWIYEDVYDKSDMDSLGLAMAQKMFSGMIFDFNDNGKYELVMMGKTDKGTWKLAKDQKTITLNSEKDGKQEIRILEIDRERLVVQIFKGTFIMVKEE